MKRTRNRSRSRSRSRSKRRKEQRREKYNKIRFDRDRGDKFVSDSPNMVFFKGTPNSSIRKANSSVKRTPSMI